MATINKNFNVKNGIDVGQNATITGSLTASGLSYPVSDGDPFMAITTDGAGNLSFANVDTVESDVTNQTGTLIPKGTPVYQTGAAGQTLTIAPSDASNAATMPAIGVAGSDIADGSTGRVIHFGYIKGVDTSAFSEGDRIYVADGGGYQVGRPTGEGNVVQFLGVVTKVHATNGSGVVFGGGRAHAVPNLNDGNIFIGDNTDSPVTATLDTSIVPENGNIYFTNQRAIDAIEGAAHLTIDGGTLYVDTSNNYVGINDTSPSQALDVTGNIAVAGVTVIDSGSEIVTARLKDSGVTAGSYGTASLIPVITVDSKGRITSASTTSVAGVSNFTFDNLTDELTIATADGNSFTADISNITVGGSLVGPLGDITVQYGVNYSGTPNQGSFFFDSLNQKLKVYTGTEFVDAVPAGTGTTGGGDTTDAVATVEKYTYTITSTTNALSGGDDNGNTLSYVVDGSQNVELFVNGIKQVEGASNDYVATTGTSVTLTYNLAAGDVVDVMIYELLTQDAFYLKADTYTKTEVNTQISTALTSYLPLTGGSLTGALAVNGTTVIDAGGEVVTAQLKDSGVTAGSYGSAAQVPVITVDAKGRITSASTTAVAGVSSTAYDTSTGVLTINTSDGGSFTEDLGVGTADSPTFATGTTVSGSFRVTETGTAQTILIGNQDSGGLNKPSMIMGVNGSLRLGYGDSWTGEGGNMTTGLTVDSNSNVGVGTISPQAELHVAGNLLVETGSPDIYLGTSSASHYNWRIAAQEVVDAGFEIAVGTQSAGSAAQNDTYTTLMTVKNTGSVGIGDNGPVSKMVVVTGNKDSAGNLDGGNVFSVQSGPGNLVQKLNLGVDSTDSIAFIQSVLPGISTRPLALNPTGGDTWIGSDTVPDADTTGLRITNGGFGLLSGTVSSGTNQIFVINNTSTGGTAQQQFRVAGTAVGSIDFNSSGTTYNTTSDRRLKDNIVTITNGKEKLLAMNPVTHTWKADPNTGETVHGFIAQEMQQIVPEAVSGDPDSETMMSMDYGRITPVIVAALQDALKEIEELKERIKTLEAK